MTNTLSTLPSSLSENSLTSSIKTLKSTHFLNQTKSFTTSTSWWKNQEMGRESWVEIGRRLKKAVKKFKLLLTSNVRLWCLRSTVGRSSYSRRLSFDDRLGLHGCIEDDKLDGDRYHLLTTGIQRASSFASDDYIDKRAEIFIANFRRQLRLERQVSLDLNYSRSTGSSFKGDKEN